MPEAIPQKAQTREELIAKIQEHRIRTAILLADTAIFLADSDRRVERITQQFEEAKSRTDEAIQVLKTAFAIKE